MAESLSSDIQLEIAHVLFIDIVGYSKLLIDEQRELQQQLNQIVRNTDQFRTAETAEKLVRLPTGDGIALVFFTSPEAPVQCALQISEALQNHPQLRLRMGINTGPVSGIADVNDRSNVAGAGINMAQRVMDLGDAGHILLSKRAAEDLIQYRQWQAHLHDLGEFEVKHGVKISVVNLYSEKAGNPQVPEKLKQLSRKLATTRRLKRTLIAALLLLAVALPLGALILLRYGPAKTATSGAAEAILQKSIAVLPFANMSEAKENAFFAAGIQDDILTSLAKIDGLRVISRTSVMGYRSDAARNLREIGKALGVANVLEGSVRREGNRVVVNVQLIDALHDRHLWANRYDRTIADSLGLQGELATEIAKKLSATLSPDEKARVETKPTENAEAYVFYLRANQIERNPDTLLEDYKTAQQLYLQAVALDPNFALAHARLASTCGGIFHFYEPLDSWKTKARAEAELALRLQPNLAEAHLAVGQCAYWIDEDYERALQEFDRAAQLSPNNADVRVFIASIKRRQGHWQECLDAFEAAQKIDPQNPNIARNVLFTNTAMRRWPEASRVAGRFRAMAPASLVAKIQSGYVDFWWKGDTALLKSLVSGIPASTDPDGVITSVRWEIAMINRDYPEAKRVLDASPLTEFSYTNAAATPKSFLEGCILLAQGDSANAQKLFEAARPGFESAVREAPASADRHANLGWLYAFMGRKEDAIREGRRAVELKPESKDAYDGAIMNCYLALIYARSGDKELAFPLIERLLKTPGAVDSVDYSITINDLKYRWEWDPIRNDPRFNQILPSALKP
jgi:TolB-like protein/class 3 adenylate cyclase/Flp pilus assembly protein TadD